MSKLSKEDYIKIRNSKGEDCIPVLHAYHNHMLNLKPKNQLSLEEFRLAYGNWLRIPIVAVSQGSIISTVFRKMDKIYGI